MLKTCAHNCFPLPLHSLFAVGCYVYVWIGACACIQSTVLGFQAYSAYSAYAFAVQQPLTLAVFTLSASFLIFIQQPHAGIRWPKASLVAMCTSHRVNGVWASHIASWNPTYVFQCYTALFSIYERPYVLARKTSLDARTWSAKPWCLALKKKQHPQFHWQRFYAPHRAQGLALLAAARVQSDNWGGCARGEQLSQTEDNSRKDSRQATPTVASWGPSITKCRTPGFPIYINSA